MKKFRFANISAVRIAVESETGFLGENFLIVCHELECSWATALTIASRWTREKRFLISKGRTQRVGFAGVKLLNRFQGDRDMSLMDGVEASSKKPIRGVG